MLLALALCASIAHANTPQCALDFLDHDGNGTETVAAGRRTRWRPMTTTSSRHPYAASRDSA